jgi:hypothetical protein
MINRDFRDLFAAFAARNVRFLIVGGYAVARTILPLGPRPVLLTSRWHCLEER